jgi:GT2 family glycosyltransferase
MDSRQWRAWQRELREQTRLDARTPDGRAPLPGGSRAPENAGGRIGSRPRPSTGRPRPFVTVIVVCWNSGDVLDRCLEHLHAQEYPNYEIVVVDDGSDDDTLAVAESSRSHGDLTIVRSSRNRGCPHARNLGLSHANGEIVAFIDADGFATSSWLDRLVEAFEADDTVGAVASTVFFDANPMVINGAGGIVNRQGWAADLSIGQSYEQAEIATEALYPMGCGMAFRRSAIDRVGAFDDRMLNYYDDVDYGIRAWRAGYRVIVAPDAWIDHGFRLDGANSRRKRLLCERHRMRVVLKHASLGTLARWMNRELREVKRAAPPVRDLKMRAMAWNVCHLPSSLKCRLRLRGAHRLPERLVDPTWGDGFPAGVPELLSPCPAHAGSRVEMAEPGSETQLIHGWFPVEHIHGRSYRWAGTRAAALIRLDEPARRLRLDYVHVPMDIGAIKLDLLPVGSLDRLAPVWSASLPWQSVARSVENHPVSLPAGNYEVVFSAGEGWLEAPLKTRSLAFALSSMSFDASYEIDPGGLDMASANVEEQLVQGWFEPEQSADHSYRWATRRAAALVRIAESTDCATLRYRLPPVASDVKLTVCTVDQQLPVWSTRIPWHDPDWHEDSFALDLAAGDYLVAFDSEAAWSNPNQRDPALWAENRSLGLALSSLSFGRSA